MKLSIVNIFTNVSIKLSNVILNLIFLKSVYTCKIHEYKYSVLYNEPTVYQQRNVHNLIKDFKDEYIGYVNSLNLVESLYKNSDNITKFLPKKSSLAFDEWKKLIE